MKTLVPLQPIPSLQGNASYAGQSSTSGRESPGSQFNGEVVKDLGNNTFLINVGGKQVQVQSQSILKVGQQLRLAVTQSDPPQLRILSSENQINQTSQQQAQPTISATQLLSSSSVFAAKSINLTGLFALLTRINPSQNPLSADALTNITTFSSLQNSFLNSTKESGLVLQQLIQHLGLGHERSVQQNQTNTDTSQLKNSLLQILASFPNTAPISREANSLVSIIETFQLANIAHSNQDEQILPLPFSFLDQGFLQIFNDDRNEDTGQTDQEKNFRFSLFLGMSKLGNLQIDFTGIDEGIYLHIHTESKEVSEFIETYAAEFIEELSKETTLLGIRFTEDAVSPAVSLLQMTTPEKNTGLVNTKA